MNRLLYLFLFSFFYIGSFAQIPTGYYDAGAGKSCAPLKSALKKIISTGYIVNSYDNLYDQYMKSDVKHREVGSGNESVIWDIYSDNPSGTDPYNYDPTANQCGSYNSEGDCFNREHTVPQSWFNSEVIPGSDYLHIMPTDGYVNNKRANYLYGEVSNATWTSKNGSKQGSSAIAGIPGPVFEPIDTYKGDVARAFFYFVTRYQSNIPGWSSNTDAFSHDTFPSVNVIYLNMLLAWNIQDPVSQKEIDRNNAAYTYQHNRNPFIDHPEYVNLVWNGTCPGLGTLPVNIIYFTGKLFGNTISLNWKTGTEINLKKYEVEKSFNGTSFTTIAQINAVGSLQYSLNDNVSKQTGRRIYYRLKKIDNDGSFTYSEIFSVPVPLNQVFTVSPNPAGNFITLQLKETTVYTAQLIILDLAGKIVMNQQFKTGSGAVTIPVSHLQNGAYFIKIFMNGEQFVQKLVIIR